MSFLRANGNLLRAGLQFLRAIPRSSNVVTYNDNFTTYSAASLDGQGNWVDGTSEGDHVYVVNDSGNNVVSGEVGSWDGIARRSDITNPNQFSQLVLTAVAGAQLGVVVRSQGSLTTQDYFAYYVTNATRTLQQVLNRTVSVRGSVASGASPGDIIKIEARDMSVYCYYNGEIDTAMSGGGIYTIPSGMESGMPGIMAYGSSTQGDNWQGGYYKKTVTDDFEAYTEGELGGQGNWIDITYNAAGHINIINVSGDNTFSSADAISETCAIQNGIFSPKQYSQITIDNNTGESGAAVRASSLDGSTFFIAYQGMSLAVQVYYVINNFWTEIASGGTVSNGDVLRLEIDGNILRAYKNGLLDTALTGGTGIIDITSIINAYPAFASGSPGISSYTTAGRGDNFVGGDL